MLFSGTVEFAIEKQATPEDGFSATYKLKRTAEGTGTYVGDAINIPKDAVLSGGTYEIVETADTPYAGAVVGDLPSAPGRCPRSWKPVRRW